MILIIGAGFIGKTLYNSLLDKGHKVKVFSKKGAGINPEDFIQGDYNEIEKHHNLLDNISIVINAIHTTVPATSYQNEIYDVNTNIISFLKLLNLCKAKGIKKFIYISSGGAVYGNSTTEKQMDEQFPTNPISSYGITKLCCEKYLLLHKDLFSEGIIILRPTNIFGTGQNLLKKQGIIGHLVNASISGTTIEIWGDGSARKDYLHISDFMQGIQNIIESKSKLDNHIFNISNGRTFTILDLIKIIEQKTNKKISLTFTKEKVFDVKNVSLSNDLFSKTFNWTPKFDLIEGIDKMIPF